MKPGPKRRPLKERFLKKLPACRDPAKCWDWQGSCLLKGYGQILLNGRRVLAHRVAWELANNREVPEGMQVNHHCDNRPCCNPRHLYVGTQADNMRDMVQRGRARNGISLGEAHGNVKVPDHLVREAVALVKSGLTLKEASEVVREKGYACSLYAVHDWVTGKYRRTAFSKPQSQCEEDQGKSSTGGIRS